MEEHQLINRRAALDVLRQVGVGEEEPLAVDQIFVRDVLRWLSRRVFSGAEANDPSKLASIFVFGADLDGSAVLANGEFIPSFGKTFSHVLGGRAHCCKVDLKGMFRADVGLTDVTSALKWLKQASQLDKHAVIFVPAESVALVYDPRRGLDDCTTVDFHVVADRPVSFDDMDDLLNTFHELSTATSLSYCQVWNNAKLRQFKHRAELQIQGTLLLFFNLTIAKHGALVDSEFQTRKGRGDVRIVRWSGGNTYETCLLELKVLRKQKGDLFNERWALCGLRQIKSYRGTQQGPTLAYLCCFDGREGDKDMPRVEEEALRMAVRNRRYFMATPGCGMETDKPSV